MLGYIDLQGTCSLCHHINISIQYRIARYKNINQPCTYESMYVCICICMYVRTFVFVIKSYVYLKKKNTTLSASKQVAFGLIY